MRTGTFLFALFLILAGTILFLTNLGFFSFHFGWQLTRLWPLALIIIGLGLFWGGKIPRPLAVTLALVLVVGIVALAFVFPGPVPRLGTGVRSDLVVTRELYPDLREGSLSLRFGGGMLFLDTRTRHWFAGDFEGFSLAVPSYGIQQEKLSVVLRQGQNIVVWPGPGRANAWRISLSPELRWDLEMDSGAVDGELDLQGLPLGKVKLKMGAGNMTLRLGHNGDRVKVKVEAGASNLRIQVPEDTGLSLSVSGALAGNNLKELGWPQVDGRYRSPAYETLPDRIDLELEMAVGNFTVEVLPVQR